MTPAGRVVPGGARNLIGFLDAFKAADRSIFTFGAATACLIFACQSLHRGQRLSNSRRQDRLESFRF
ncbi:hypothetical protein [Nitrobacter winogradskyi]|uniref:hypothetical protein n=1 Tax=Nitrobacter winogradskyi TaxID=913 RepID=UPI001AEE9087|nr:hypothetical protein [Nitrobacter winogradskyi]